MKQIIRQVTPLAWWPALIKLRSRLLSAKTSRFEIPINQCVHYSGFRYGCDAYNPIERYLRDIDQQRSMVQARYQFIRFLLHYRPRHMGEAIGAVGISRPYPMWRYPWDVINPQQPCGAWCETPYECQDIMTHFSAAGILSYRIDEEFLWGERALHSIAANGYDPDVFGARHATSFEPIRTLELRKRDGCRAFLLLDGNHRVGALSVLGETTVMVERAATDIVYEADCEQWYSVKAGIYDKDDAMRVFHAYFEGNHRYHTSAKPARIIGPVQWTQMYMLPNTEEADSCIAQP